MKVSQLSLLTLLPLAGAAPGALWLDFNSNQANGGGATAGDPTAATAVHNEAGYMSYHVNHESAAHVNPATAGIYNTSFSQTGAATVSVLPDWPNSSSNAIRQSIGRSDGQAGSWLGNNQNLLRDWIGVDSRTSAGATGGWDGINGTPTYMTLSLGGLPAADYSMTSFHHDVENMNAFFTIEVSTDGGATYGAIMNGRMTNSLAGGTPAENEILPGSGVNVAGGDPADLSSTMVYGFTANGTDDVVVRFAPLGPGNMVHQDFFGINGFQLSQIPEPTTGVLGLFGALLLLRRRR